MSRDIPAAIRLAVILRTTLPVPRRLRTQPAAACEVHHTKHKANGGKTSVTDCALSSFTTRSSSTNGAGPWS